MVLTVVFQLFSRDMLLMFGASPNTIEYAVSYMKIYSLGTLFVQQVLIRGTFLEGFNLSNT